jgi:hypothetical protein
MKRKILAHLVSVLVGLFLGYYSHNFPILPLEVVANNFTMWSFFIKQYWWLMLIFFVVGYGITFGIFYFFNKNK